MLPNVWVHVKFLLSPNESNTIVQCLLCLQEHVRNVVLCKETSQEAYLLKKDNMTRKERKALNRQDLGPIKSQTRVSKCLCKSISYFNVTVFFKDFVNLCCRLDKTSEFAICKCKAV